MFKNPWKTIGRKIIYKNKFGYTLREDGVITPSGKKGTYTVLEGRGYVIIIPVTKEGKILLLREWRYPINEASLELPAGTLEKHEKPEETAKRELFEETGASSNKWSLLGTHWLGNGIMKVKGYVYLAKDISIVKKQQDNINEVLSTKIMTPKQILHQIIQGKIQDARTQIGMFFFQNSCHP